MNHDLNTAAQTTDTQESPILVEEVSIEELAVREEYAACYCPGK